MKKMTLVLGLILAFFVQDILAQPIGRRFNAIDLSNTEKATLATAMLGYINQAIIEEHSCNNEFGNAQGATGSIHGPEMFLNWHRMYLAEMEDALETTLTVTIPEYKTIGPNYVYVRVRNRSTTDEFAGGRLRVYWSKASTGLNWPDTWIDYDPDGTGLIYGDEITPTNPTIIDNTDPTNPIFIAPIPVESNFVLPPIPPGGSFIVEIPWMVPNPLDYGTDDHHFCLLARVVSAFDDFAFQEGETLWQNVAENNNIAWKNVQIVDLDPMNIIDPNWNFNLQVMTTSITFNGVYTSNPSGNTQNTTLTFETGKTKKGPNFHDIGGVVVAKMDMDLYNAWLNGGALSSGINRLGEYNGYFYAEITDPYATLENIDLPARTNYYLAMGYALTKSVPDGEEHDYDVRQYNERGFVGGERYEIRINTPRGEVPVDATKRSDELALAQSAISISPNPATDQFTVMYSLETAAEVSMALYDVSGRLVKEIAPRTYTKGLQSQSVDATGLNQGLYLLKVQLGNKVITKKVVVETP